MLKSLPESRKSGNGRIERNHLEMKNTFSDTYDSSIHPIRLGSHNGRRKWAPDRHMSHRNIETPTIRTRLVVAATSAFLPLKQSNHVVVWIIQTNSVDPDSYIQWFITINYSKKMAENILFMVYKWIK